MSPSQNIILDYYDGPLRGFMRLDSNTFFFFRLLAWDESQDYRIFVLSKASQDTFFLILDLLKECGKATSQSWFPRLAALSDDAKVVIKTKMDEMQSHESMIVGSEDGLRTISKILDLTEGKLSAYKSLCARNPKPHFAEWKQFLDDVKTESGRINNPE